MVGCPSAITFGRDDAGRPVYNHCLEHANHTEPHHAIVHGTVIDSRGLPSVEVGVEVRW